MNYIFRLYYCENDCENKTFLFFHSDLRARLRREKRNVHDSGNLPVSNKRFFFFIYKYESISLVFYTPVLLL